jgi:hypothetical protein
MANFLDFLEADQYLGHRYEAAEEPVFPLPDEDFVEKWSEWLEDPLTGDLSDDLRGVLAGGDVRVWIEATPAGRLPVIYATERSAFERLAVLLDLRARDNAVVPPKSVNAFTIRARCPGLEGHRVILLNRSGYSALAGSDVGAPEGDWLERSMTLRLHHECCHYFTLRVLGGMKNHALDEIVADCAGQLAAFGTYSAAMQRKFFGMSEGAIAPGGRLAYYMKKLSEGAISEVCKAVNAALSHLENYLRDDADMTEERKRPALILKLASLGVRGITEL